MKEVLYRGLTTQKPKSHAFNHVWVEGDLIISDGKYYIHPRSNKVRVQGELGQLIIMHEVIPETVGQFTGLSDKNGKKIFKGDIVRCFYQTWFTDYSLSYVVEWNKKKFCWSLHMLSSEVQNNISEDEHFACEVIGNIHDNPELLEG